MSPFSGMTTLINTNRNAKGLYYLVFQSDSASH